MVSSLSPESANGGRRRRELRVYDREGGLQSTSEPVAGLEHVLSWRPSGNLIASTQRFGFEGGGAGKESRHDIVFFERNGLKHGDFGLRIAGAKKEGNSWGYKVREVSWSSDSNVLLVWIEHEDRDVGLSIFLPSSTELLTSASSTIVDHLQLPLVSVLT